MDRTREFNSVVKSTNVHQAREKREGGPMERLSQRIEGAEKRVRNMSDSLERKEDGEFEDDARAVEGELVEIGKAIEEIQAEEGYDALRGGMLNVLRRKHAAISLALTDALGKRRKIGREREGRKKGRHTAFHEEDSGLIREEEAQNAEQAQLLHEEEVQREEMSGIRRREMEKMEAHINELGRMVSGVSMQISMQGEKLQRIDEQVSMSKKRLAAGRRELLGTLEKVSTRRKAILMFFGLLFGLLLLKLYFKRS